MHLDLSGHWFVNIPINIHELSKLRSLKLNGCISLQFLPKLPSSIRELETYGCNSLNTFESNVLSTICNAFESSSRQDQENEGVILQMLIPGKEIPPFIHHQEDGSGVALGPYPSDCSLNKNLKDNFYAPYYFSKILRAGWVRVEDIDDLNKSDVERQSREGQGVFRLE
ncbi:hypothetical protein PIB30_045540 [Stylosanthes scabra]|uniref:Uncharacterized protein n=1 Tax=Stylosanthes scabra TaxID=79078 RepID=A0ABU6UFW3_9FABA|nr:hypothetical protein [Stylosanthes scabra]